MSCGDVGLLCAAAAAADADAAAAAAAAWGVVGALRSVTRYCCL